MEKENNDPLFQYIVAVSSLKKKGWSVVNQIQVERALKRNWLDLEDEIVGQKEKKKEMGNARKWVQ